MVSLNNIRAQIRSIRQDAEAGNTTAAVAALETLTLDIIQADIPLFLMKKRHDVYVASAEEGDPRTFVRIFTHENLAHSYLKHVEEGTIEEVSVIESLQLSKFLFLRGVYGLILNDGDEWAAISLPDYVGLFCKRVLKQEVSISPSYINCVQLITAVQKNSLYRLSYLTCEGQPEVVIDGQLCCYVVDQENEQPLQSQTVKIPLTLPALFKFHHRIVVRSRHLVFALDDYTELHKVLKGYCVEYQGTEQTVGFYDEPVCWGEGGIDYHSIQDLSLAFVDGDVWQKEPKNQDTALVLVPGKGQYDGSTGNQYVAEGTEQLYETARNECFSDRTNKRKWNLWWKRENKEDRQRTPKRIRRSIELGVGIIAILMMLNLVGSLLNKVIESQGIVQFEKALSCSDYVRAYELYSRGNQQKYDTLLEKEIDSLISQYARNRIGTAEIKARLQAMTCFPGQTATLANAAATVARLEVSKEAFVEGLQSEDVIDKLSRWMKVIPLDVEHYDAVQAEVGKNREVWSKILLKRIEQYAYADRLTSYDYTEIGIAMFPQEKDFEVWADIFSDELNRPLLSSYPIHIKEIDVCKQSNNTVTVYIKWKNESLKSFQSVDFYFAFLNAAGERVTYQKRGEEKVIFQGVESRAAPYEPGFEIMSDTWGWNGIWPGCGEKIEQIKLTCVKVHYMDGGTDIFFLQQDLDAILNLASVH